MFIFGANRIETPTSRHSPSGFVVVRSSGARQPAFSHAYTSPRPTVAAADGRAQGARQLHRQGTKGGRAGRDEIARQLQRRARIISVPHTARRQLRYSALR